MLEWIEIIPEKARLQRWNSELLKTSAEAQQYPYWNERFRMAISRPRYICWREEAFAAVLDVGVPGLRVGLIQFGPVSLSGSPTSFEAFESLRCWARRKGFAFVRIVHHNRDILDAVSNLPPLHAARELFPFNQPPKEDLVVHQRPLDCEMLRGFQKIARQEIKTAGEHGYEIEATQNSDVLRRIWPMFLEQSKRKGIKYGPLNSYALLMDEAKPQGLAWLYLARLSDKVVYAALICRASKASYYLIGALDRDALGDAPSPSCLLHWTAMRNLYGEGIEEYNLGTRSGPVYAFKRKFRPEERVIAAMSLVALPLKFRVWTASLAAYNHLRKFGGFRKAERVLRTVMLPSG